MEKNKINVSIYKENKILNLSAKKYLKKKIAKIFPMCAAVFSHKVTVEK